MKDEIIIYDGIIFKYSEMGNEQKSIERSELRDYERFGTV